MIKAEMTLRARILRKKSTPAERILWKILRNRRLDGLKFLRQHPIYFNMYKSDHYYILDFYCEEKKVAIELDGNYHKNNMEYDEMRDGELKLRKNIRVLRLWNEEAQDPEKVKARIREFINENR